jgi:chromosome segregation ATPase
MHSDRQMMGMSPRSGGASEEDLDSLRRSVRGVEATAERVSELKASVENLQRQTESVRSKQTDTTEALAAQLGEVGGLKKQLDMLASTVASQAAASTDMVQLKAGVSSVEREISTMRSEQQQLGAVDANHSASIAGLKAELNALQQAHTQTQSVARDLQSVVGDTRSEVKASGSQLQSLEQAIAATKAQVATNSAALEANLSGLDGKVSRITERHEQQEQAVQVSRMIEAQQVVAREQMEAAAQFDTQLPEEGDPPSPLRATGAMMDELGFVTRRIATLQLEQEVLAQAVEENPGAAARLEEVVQELSALESALDQLGIQVGMDPSPAPSEYDDDESYDGEEMDAYGQDDSDPGPVRQYSSRRRPDRLRAARSRPSGPTDREAAWARAHAHAFGRASMKPDT